MGWLVAQGALLTIGVVIGLIFALIGLFFGHIILFDSLALGIVAGICCNRIWSVHPALGHWNRYVSPAVLAAAHPGRILDCGRTSHADLRGGIRLAGLFPLGRRLHLGLGCVWVVVPPHRRAASSRQGTRRVK